MNQAPGWSKRSLYPGPHWAGGGDGSSSKMTGRQRGIPDTFSRSCESPAGQGLSMPVCLLPAHSCISILLWMILSHSHQGI